MIQIAEVSLPPAPRFSSTTFYHASFLDDDDKTLFVNRLEDHQSATILLRELMRSRKMRTAIHCSLTIITAVAVMVLILTREDVSFGEPRFTAFPELNTFWGDRPTLVICRIAVTNEAWFPFWYEHASCRLQTCEFAKGALPSTSEILENSGAVINWKRLNPGETIERREYGIDRYDEIGLQVADWTGCVRLIQENQIDIEQLWLVRDSLPKEIPLEDNETPDYH